MVCMVGWQKRGAQDARSRNAKTALIYCRERKRKVSKGLGVREIGLLEWIYHVRLVHLPQECPHNCEK